jgi:branched-chain amino acid transport system ATP-binding protein
MSNAMVCDGLVSGYDRIPVLHGLDLQVEAGKVTALMGPNGAGKTTLLLTVAGVLKPLRGELTVLGEAVRPGRPHLVARRGVALVPDGRALFAGLTAEENVRLALAKARRKAPPAGVIDYFPALRSKWHLRAGLLSGGEQQMLAIGRALVCGAELLMIDEMSLGLAPIVVKNILPVLANASRELGTSILIVEQHIDLALEVADYAYVLRRGVVHVEGKPSELRANSEVIRSAYLGDIA